MILYMLVVILNIKAWIVIFVICHIKTIALIVIFAYIVPIEIYSLKSRNM